MVSVKLIVVESTRPYTPRFLYSPSLPQKLMLILLSMFVLILMSATTEAYINPRQQHSFRISLNINRVDLSSRQYSSRTRRIWSIWSPFTSYVHYDNDALACTSISTTRLYQVAGDDTTSGSVIPGKEMREDEIEGQASQQVVVLDTNSDEDVAVHAKNTYNNNDNMLVSANDGNSTNMISTISHVSSSPSRTCLPRWRRALPGNGNLGKLRFRRNKLSPAESTMTTTGSMIESSSSNNSSTSGSEGNLDRLILATAIPSIINLAVVPLVNAVDTFWVGRMGNALSLAGQAAANSCFFTAYFLVAFLPTMTAPLVAEAVGSGQVENAQDRVCESIFLCWVLGGIGTLLLVGRPEWVLRKTILPAGAPALEYAAPYLRWRALSMIPALLSATGFAAYRGLLDTVTPLRVSIGTNLLNLVLDPLLMFAPFSRLGLIGAATATALSETVGGLVYLKLLLQRKLATMTKLLRPPSWKAMMPILQGGLALLGRQAAINVAILGAARKAQSMDAATGVAAAAFGIVNQLYSVGIVIHVAIQGTAAAMVPSIKAKEGNDGARQVADRMFVWGTIIGAALAFVQWVTLPHVLPVFSTVPAVQEAAKVPARLSAFLHILNGPVFVGGGVMLGQAQYRGLALLTALSASSLLVLLSIPFFGTSLKGVVLSQILFSCLQASGVIWHHLKIGPLAVDRKKVVREQEETGTR